MVVNYVEVVSLSVDPGEHVERRNLRTLVAIAQSQRTCRACNQLRRGLRIAAGEEAHLVLPADQLFRQASDHTFCTAVHFWRHRFIQRCNYGYPHPLLRATWPIIDCVK